MKPYQLQFITIVGYGPLHSCEYLHIELHGVFRCTGVHWIFIMVVIEGMHYKQKMCKVFILFCNAFQINGVPFNHLNSQIISRESQRDTSTSLAIKRALFSPRHWGKCKLVSSLMSYFDKNWSIDHNSRKWGCWEETFPLMRKCWCLLINRDQCTPFLQN